MRIRNESTGLVTRALQPFGDGGKFGIENLDTAIPERLVRERLYHGVPFECPKVSAFVSGGSFGKLFGQFGKIFSFFGRFMDCQRFNPRFFNGIRAGILGDFY